MSKATYFQMPILALLLVTSAIKSPAFAQQASLTARLYAGPSPGSEAWKLAETKHVGPNGEVVYSNVRDPEFSVFLPDPKKANGAAVLYLPGGGMRMLVFGKGFSDLVALLNDHGVAVISLKYRVMQEDPSAPRKTSAAPYAQSIAIANGNANPEPQNQELTTVLHLATADAQETIRRIRAHAKEWRLDPDRIGIFGESAGGGVMFGVLMANDSSSRPNFLVSNFGPALQDVHVDADAPPLFMVVESNHGLVTDGLQALVPIWKRSKRPVELHIYEYPNFTMPVSLWGERLLSWMAEQHIMAATTPQG